MVEKSNKIGKPLAILIIKKKREGTLSTNIKNCLDWVHDRKLMTYSKEITKEILIKEPCIRVCAGLKGTNKWMVKHHFRY